MSFSKSSVRVLVTRVCALIADAAVLCSPPAAMAMLFGYEGNCDAYSFKAPIEPVKTTLLIVLVVSAAEKTAVFPAIAAAIRSPYKLVSVLAGLELLAETDRLGWKRRRYVNDIGASFCCLMVGNLAGIVLHDNK